MTKREIEYYFGVKDPSESKRFYVSLFSLLQALG